MTEHLEIHIGKTTAESSIKANGENISQFIQGVIVESYGGQPTQVTLKVVPFKVAPFDVSGPFMRVPRCDGCLFWDQHDNSDLVSAPCNHPALSAGIGQGPWTQPDFGCVQFKPTLTGAPHEPT